MLYLHSKWQLMLPTKASCSPVNSEMVVEACLGPLLCSFSWQGPGAHWMLNKGCNLPICWDIHTHYYTHLSISLSRLYFSEKNKLHNCSQINKIKTDTDALIQLAVIRNWGGDNRIILCGHMPPHLSCFSQNLINFHKYFFWTYFKT